MIRLSQSPSSDRNMLNVQMNSSRFINSRNYINSVWLSLIPIGVIFLIYLIINLIINSNDIQIGLGFYLFIISGILIIGNIIFLITLSSIMNFSIYWRSSLLCNIFLIGFMLVNQHSFPSIVCFGYYMMCLSFFHLSEFIFTALFNHSEVSIDSFLLNHSIEYALAAMASWTEFLIELLLIPSIKLSLYTKLIGLFLCFFGEYFRKQAMYTAGKNFNHYVQERKKEDHILVQTGVYSLVRHPSYFGWFYWSIGTQILLANPICTIIYAVASWKFFQARISYEEFHLLKFFGRQYVEYQKKTPTGIPFVKGYIIYAEDSLD